MKEIIIKTLKARGKPMHLNEITRAVLAKNPKLKGKTPRMTVNAVLSTNPQFKRVAKGVYALKAWKQYSALRKVKDIAYDLLLNEGKPLPLEVITARVLAERSLKGRAKGTIRNILKKDRRLGEVKKGVFELSG